MLLIFKQKEMCIFNQRSDHYSTLTPLNGFHYILLRNPGVALNLCRRIHLYRYVHTAIIWKPRKM